jgi:hypothetical protein
MSRRLRQACRAGFVAILAVSAGCTLLAPSDDDFLGGELDARKLPDGHRAPDSSTPADVIVMDPDPARDGARDATRDGARDATRDDAVEVDASPPVRPCDGGCGPTELCLPVGTSSECVAPAAALDGQRWDLVCGENYGVNSCRLYPPGTSSCPQNGYYPINRSIAFGGRKGVLYDLTLRFRGVVEPKTYTGGTPAGDNFYIGGMPSPSNFNAYGFTVSAPLPVVQYYLNFEPVRGERDYILTFDYQKTIVIEGGATVNLIAYTQQCGLLRNCHDFTSNPCVPYVIESLSPAPNPNGHVIQVDVVAVAERR